MNNMENRKYISWGRMLANAKSLTYFIQDKYPEEAVLIGKALFSAECYFTYSRYEQETLDKALGQLRAVRDNIHKKTSEAFLVTKETDPLQFKSEIFLVDGEIAVARHWTKEQQEQHQKNLDVYYGLSDLQGVIDFLVEMIRSFYPDHYPTVAEVKK